MRFAWPLAGALALAACESSPSRRVAPADTEPPPRAECPEPQLSAAALAVHATGATRIAYEVEESGKIARVAIVHPSGDSPAHRLRDEAVVAARSQCRFPPLPGGGLRKGEEEFVWR